MDYVRTSRSPELPVLLLDDSGALIGLLFATAGGALVIVLAIEMKSLLIGEAASPEVIQRIEGELEHSPGVRRVIHVLTQHLKPDELLVAAKLEFETSLSMAALAGAVNGCEARVRSVVPAARFVYLEPDLLAHE